MKRRDFLRFGGCAAALAAAGCASTATPSRARVVVIGGGFGGATAAKYIRMWDPKIDVVLVERDPSFISCPISNLVLTPQVITTLGEPFQRGRQRIRADHAGVGLGLAIVRSITQAHDGTLTLTPRAAGGLRVTVQLPAAPPHTGR